MFSICQDNYWLSAKWVSTVKWASWKKTYQFTTKCPEILYEPTSCDLNETVLLRQLDIKILIHFLQLAHLTVLAHLADNQ